MIELLNILRRQAGYASVALCGVLVALEHGLPGSVLPYIPLIPLCIIAFALLVSMPKKEGAMLVNYVLFLLLGALLCSLIFFKLRDVGGISVMLLILAGFAVLILAAVVLYPRE